MVNVKDKMKGLIIFGHFVENLTQKKYHALYPQEKL